MNEMIKVTVVTVVKDADGCIKGHFYEQDSINNCMYV